VSTTSAGGIVLVGTRVRVRGSEGEDEFTIVMECEADAAADRVSSESPCGRALLGHRVGDRVWFRAPGGIMSLTVLSVS
jgi:transcription elongation factor GreA